MNNPKHINLINKLVYPTVITSDDMFDIASVITDMIDSYIIDNIIEYSTINFKEEMYSSIYDLIYTQIQPIYIEDITSDLNNILTVVLKLYLNIIVPPRSYKKTFIRVKPNISIIKTQIKYLTDIPQPDQRTSEWYKMRHSLITASNAWKSFGTESEKNQLIYSKCIELDLSKYSRTNTSSPFHHGIRYEPLSIMLYEQKYNTKIDDFGCIIHDKYKFLGASPDGINTLDTSDRFGRMLEVKNIVNRVIDGIPKVEYWIQMQLQMEVCNLNECDFLETRFIEYENKEEFIDDGTFKKTFNNKPKGIIMYFINGCDIHYEYAPLSLTKSDYSKWEEEMMVKNKKYTWIKNIYWKLDQYSCVLVLRNKLWLKSAIKQIENIWNIIKTERVSGFDHRAPKRRCKRNYKSQHNTTEQYKLNKCLINADGTVIERKNTSNAYNSVDKSDQSIKIITEPINNAIVH
jgi:putative phage-type endonuclease